MATELAPGATGQDLTADLTADRELKARHRATWALGAYPDVARRVVPGLGAVLVEACGVRPGDRVLDVGAGTGNAAIPAAERGAQVLATDLTPELLAAGRHRVEGRDLALQWQEADAEALPLPDGGFDVVLSCIGAMFAPHHRATADELVRVCRPGGTIGMLNWTPEGFIGRLFAAMKPFLPPPPPGVQPPPLWGDEQHVRDLFGDRVADLTVERRMLTVSAFGSPAEFRDYFRENYGPTVAAYRAGAADPARTAALDAAIEDVARQAWVDLPSGGSMDWEYLLLVARRV